MEQRKKTNSAVVKKPVTKSVAKPVTKPKAPKVKKPKAPKVKKPKTIKVAKAPRPKKAKKAKKTTGKKLITIIITSVVVLSIILGIGSVFTLNDFAMTTILSGNVEKSLSVVDETILENFNSRYLDIKFETSMIASDTGNVTVTSLAYLKVIKHDDNSFSYTGNFKITDTPELLVNYKNGKFFWHYQELNYSEQTTQDVRASLAPLTHYPYFNPSHILPTAAMTIGNRANFVGTKNSFALNTKPFYFGERFKFSYTGMPGIDETEIYELDHLGNIRKRIYMLKQDSLIYKSEITYLTVNKIFELTFHPSFVI
ncbi:MAG: hypothetical protein PHC46_00590 [Clostridia bacterium]|nr:hypothetical protein [Clostridia bacterium]